MKCFSCVFCTQASGKCWFWADLQLQNVTWPVVRFSWPQKMCKDFKEKCHGKVHHDMRRLRDSGRICTGGDHIDPSPVNIGLIPSHNMMIILDTYIAQCLDFTHLHITTSDLLTWLDLCRVVFPRSMNNVPPALSVLHYISDVPRVLESSVSP